MTNPNPCPNTLAGRPTRTHKARAGAPREIIYRTKDAAERARAEALELEAHRGALAARGATLCPDAECSGELAGPEGDHPDYYCETCGRAWRPELVPAPAPTATQHRHATWQASAAAQAVDLYRRLLEDLADDAAMLLALGDDVEHAATTARIAELTPTLTQLRLELARANDEVAR